MWDFNISPHWLERKGLSVSWDALLEWIHKFSRIKHRCGRSELVYTKKSSLAKLYPHVRISEIKLRLHLRSRLCSCPSHKNAILDLSTAGITAIHDFWKNETFSSNSIREENQRKTVLCGKWIQAQRFLSQILKSLCSKCVMEKAIITSFRELDVIVTHFTSFWCVVRSLVFRAIKGVSRSYNRKSKLVPASLRRGDHIAVRLSTVTTCCGYRALFHTI